MPTEFVIPSEFVIYVVIGILFLVVVVIVSKKTK